MRDISQELEQQLQAIRAEGLHRELRRVDSPQGRLAQIGGAALINFSSNDYLGLANHPVLKEAAIRAIERFGAGSGASRLICGSLGAHHELDEALAAFKGSPAALSFSSGYATSVGTITALAGKDDIIIIDKLVHASIVDGARLSGAKLRVFKHNDLNDLEDILKWADSSAADPVAQRRPRILVITESVFSMDGDVAPLKDIARLKDDHGAWLMVDEAHGTGLFGKNRRGVAEEHGVAGRVDIQMGTLGKALGAAGGYICGGRPLIDLLVNRARSFIFSTAPAPAQSGAAAAAIALVQSTEGEQRCAAVWNMISELKKGLAALGANALDSRSAILPLIIGDEGRAVECAGRLRSGGFFVPAIRYPTVSRGTARLRMTVTASHTLDDIHALCAALAEALPQG